MRLANIAFVGFCERRLASLTKPSAALLARRTTADSTTSTARSGNNARGGFCERRQVVSISNRAGICQPGCVFLEGAAHDRGRCRVAAQIGGFAGAPWNTAPPSWRASWLAARRGIDRAALDAVLDELAAYGWQSDARFAQMWIQAHAARHGAQRLRQDLRQRGVATAGYRRRAGRTPDR